MSLNIINAEYGIKGLSTYNVTGILRSMIRGSKLEIGTEININKLFCYDYKRMDPAPEQKKFLYITYQFIGLNNTTGIGLNKLKGINNKIYNEIYPEFAEKLIHPLLIMPREVHIFIHCCLVNTGGREILLDQLNQIVRSGLINGIDGIHIGILGNVGDPNYQILQGEINRLNKTGFLGRIHILYTLDRMSAWEFPTLHHLYNFCKNKEAQGTHISILYIHTKGVNSYYNPNAYSKALDWRKLMEHFLIMNYHDCLQKLQNHNAVGVNLLNKPWKHYSGNFWWSNSQYIVTLSDPMSFQKYDRWGAERWILSNANSRAISLHNSKTNHYKTNYPSSKYQHIFI